MNTTLENFGTLEFVQEKYSKLWCWKITGKLAIDKISSLSSKAWYGENENEVIIEDSIISDGSVIKSGSVIRNQIIRTNLL